MAFKGVMVRPFLWLVVVCLLLAGGCGSGTEGGSPGCEEVLAAPGEYEGVLRVDDVEVEYWMVVPEGYADLAPAPLYLHLASGSGDDDVFLEGWRPYLDDLDGLMAIVNTAAGRSTDTMVALIDQIIGDYCVDPTFVHAMGTSSSFEIAERLACEASDRIASFVAAAGGSGLRDCTPDRPVALLSFTGDPDRSGVTSLINRWVPINGCDPNPVVEDLGSGVHRKTYENCKADVVYYDIEGMGHQWPMHEGVGPWIAEYEEVDYLDEVSQFFAEHPLP